MCSARALAASAFRSYASLASCSSYSHHGLAGGRLLDWVDAATDAGLDGRGDGSKPGLFAFVDVRRADGGVGGPRPVGPPMGTRLFTAGMPTVGRVARTPTVRPARLLPVSLATVFVLQLRLRAAT